MQDSRQGLLGGGWLAGTSGLWEGWAGSSREASEPEPIGDPELLLTTENMCPGKLAKKQWQGHKRHTTVDPCTPSLCLTPRQPRVTGSVTAPTH